MIVAENKEHGIEVHQVSAQGFEVRKNGKVVSLKDQWRCEDNRRAAMFEMQRQVEDAERVAHMMSNEWQNS